MELSRLTYSHLRIAHMRTKQIIYKHKQFQQVLFRWARTMIHILVANNRRASKTLKKIVSVACNEFHAAKNIIYSNDFGFRISFFSLPLPSQFSRKQVRCDDGNDGALNYNRRSKRTSLLTDMKVLLKMFLAWILSGFFV